MSSEWLFVPEDVQAITNAVEVYTQYVEDSSPPRGYEKFHPSAFGKCLRQMQYYRYAQMGFIPMPKAENESRMLRLWQLGHDVQSRWEKYFDGMGVLRGVWKCQNPLCSNTKDDGTINVESPENVQSRRYGTDVTLGVFKPEKCVCGSTKFFYEEVNVVDESMNMYGHADMILDFSRFDAKRFGKFAKQFNVDKFPKKPIVADMKTCNKYAFDNKVTKCGPDMGYQVQLTLYANILDCEYGLLIYEGKNDSMVKAFKIPRREDTWFVDLQRQAKLMNEMVEFKKLPPPRPFSKSEYECKYCPFSRLCHKSKVWSSDDLKKKRCNFYGTLLDVK